MENLLFNQSFAILASAVISSATTLLVARLSNKVSQKIATRPPRNVAGYERLLAYIENEQKKLEAENGKLRTEIEKLREEFNIVEDVSNARRNKLLEVSREFGVDVAGLV